MNKLNIEYRWPGGYSDEVTNFILQKIDIHYHANSGHMSSGLDLMDACNIEDAYCPLLHATYIWNFSKKTKCPERYQNNGTRHKMTVSYHKDEKTSLTINTLGLSFRDIVECSTRIKECWGEHPMFCTHSGIILTFAKTSRHKSCNDRPPEKMHY